MNRKYLLGIHHSVMSFICEWLRIYIGLWITSPDSGAPVHRLTEKTLNELIVQPDDIYKEDAAQRPLTEHKV